MRSFCIHFLSPTLRVDKWVTIRARTGERRGEKQQVSSTERRIRNTSRCLTWNRSPCVFHSRANLYVPAPPGSRSVGETGNDGPPADRPRGTPLTAALGAPRRHKGIPENGICVTDGGLKETSERTTKSTSEAAFFRQGWKMEEVGGGGALKWKRWKGEGRVIECCQAEPGYTGMVVAASNSIYGVALNGKGCPVFSLSLCFFFLFLLVRSR